MKTLQRISASLITLVLCASLCALPGLAFAVDSVTLSSSSSSGSSSSSSSASSTSSSSAASSSTSSSSSSSLSADAQMGTYVFDEQGLFTSTEFNTLESQAAELASKYDMGVYFLTTDYMGGLINPDSSQRTHYATSYYKEHKLGLNPDSNGYGDGIMFVVAAKSRDYVTIAYGQGSYSFTDEGIEKIESAATSRLHNDDWYGAAKAYYDNVESQLAYYDARGKAQKPLDFGDYVIIFVIVLVIPAIVAFLIVRSEKAAMKTAVEKSEASNYLDAASLVITHSSDQFVNTTLTVTPRPKHDSDSGGGGGWGGGGGGGFSSSGGGKF